LRRRLGFLGGELLIERFTVRFLGDMVGRGPVLGRVHDLVAIVVADVVRVERLRGAERVVHSTSVVGRFGEFGVSAIHD
jgi:hypothetical protein